MKAISFKSILLIFFLNAQGIQIASAHGGGLDSRGGHYDRSTSSPTYHFHRNSRQSQKRTEKSSVSKHASNWIIFGIFAGVIYFLLRGDDSK
jgi:hypothetical protein